MTARAQLQADPSAVDLGRRQQEQTVAFDVKLTNAGHVPLEILSVTADCSCTAAAPEKRTLASGESTPLKITVETRGYVGHLRREVHVQASTGDVTIPINLIITLFKSWTLEPSAIVMPPSPRGKEAESQATLQYLGEGRAELGKITCTPDWLRVEPRSLDGKNYQLNFVKSAAAPAGNHSIAVTIETTDPDDPRLAFHVFVPVVSTLRLAPNPLVFPTIKVGQTASQELTISGWNGAGTPRLVLKSGQARLLGQDGGKFRYELTVTLASPGPFTQLLRIYDGEKLEAEIPLIARAESADKAK